MSPDDALPTDILVDISADAIQPDGAVVGPMEGALPAEDGILVFLDGQSRELPQQKLVEQHDANLAEHLDEKELKRIASKITDWVEEDTQSRREWEDCLKDGMETLGISPLSDDDRPFKGATTVTHPIIAEAAVQFQSRAIEELFPSAGPVKCKTTPKPTQEILDQAERVQDFFNYYLTDEDEEYYDDSDQMLFILALHGHIFRKMYKDPITGEPKARFVTAADLLVPYDAKSLKSADHYTHRYTMPLNDIKRAMEAGTFMEVEFDEGEFGPPEQTEERKAQDDADRRSVTSTGGGIPELYECHCDLVLEGMDEGGIALPYIVTMEKHTNKVLSIHRNWDQQDLRRQKEIWFASYKYLPGIGFYGLGLFHVLGNIAASCGAILRSIIDAGALSNLQGGFMAKQGGGRKVDAELEHGVWKEVDMTAEELKNAFYTPPFKEPSQTLLLTLRALIEAAQRFSSTTEAMVGDGPSSGPVGTTLAMIEQGSKVFSAIHKRMHRSLAAEFRCLAKLFKRMDYQYPYPVGPFTLPRDLDDRVDVMPVSDPTIVSNTQRIAMAQAAQQLVKSDPMYGPENRRMVDLALLKVMKVPNAELIVQDYTERPEEMDPVTENARMLTDKPVKAFPDQNHDAHIQAHLNFARALPPEAQKAIEGPLLAHIAEHAALKYQAMIAGAVQQTGMPVEQVAAMLPLPPLVPAMTPPPEAMPPHG